MEVADFAEIAQLSATAEGYVATGTVRLEYAAAGRCITCGQVFSIARRSIPIHFPDLVCEECGQNAHLRFRVVSLKKSATGYLFEVLASCGSCDAQRAMSQLLPHLNNISSIEAGPTGMRVNVGAECDSA